MANERQTTPAQIPEGMSEEEFVRQMDTKVLEQQRKSSGGLSDDPTQSGEPVRNRYSFKITRKG